MRNLGLLVMVLVLNYSVAARAADPTLLTITNDVLRKDISRMGLNLGSDASWGAILLKERIHDGGFEGPLHRVLWSGTRQDDQTIVSPTRAYGAWFHVYKGGTYQVIDGPSLGYKGEILDVSEEEMPAKPGAKDAKPTWVTRFQVKGQIPPTGDFHFIIARDFCTDGFVGQHGGGWWVFLDKDGKVTTAAGDVPPGSPGKAVAVLEAPADGSACILAPIADPRFMNPNGVWHLSFWAQGTGQLEIGVGDFSHRSASAPTRLPVELTPAWKHHDLTIKIEDWKLPSLALGFTVVGGAVKLDEISFVQDGDKNPSPFRDSVVAALRQFHPGSLRFLQMGGSSLENMLRPSVTRQPYTSTRNQNPPKGNVWPTHPNTNGSVDLEPLGIHEFLQLCQAVDTNPWVCLPGLMYPEEMPLLIEYLAGPPDSPGGQIRAARGQEQPWTKVFKNIYLEFGNEAWNFAMAYSARGYNGPDYWKSLIAAAKASKYFQPNIKFELGGWTINAKLNENLSTWHANADGLAVAPYMLFTMNKQEENLPPQEFWAWAFGYPWYHGHTGFMKQNYDAVSAKHNMELSIYEVNHHTTGGDASEKGVNRLVASLGGGLNVAGWMMLMLQEENVRIQNLFAFIQDFYTSQDKKKVALWGVALQRAEGFRFRPTYLAVMLLNRVLGGDLVKVAVSGADPKFSVKASYSDNKAKPSAPFEEPCIQAYATRDAKTRGLILFNFNITETLPVTLNLPMPAKPGSVTQWTLGAEAITASNETSEEVKVTEDKLPNLATGQTLQLRPFSLTVLRWEEP